VIAISPDFAFTAASLYLSVGELIFVFRPMPFQLSLLLLHRSFKMRKLTLLRATYSRFSLP